MLGKGKLHETTRNTENQSTPGKIKQPQHIPKQLHKADQKLPTMPRVQASEACVRVKSDKKGSPGNCYMELRMPSSSANPYLEIWPKSTQNWLLQRLHLIKSLPPNTKNIPQKHQKNNSQTSNKSKMTSLRFGDVRFFQALPRSLQPWWRAAWTVCSRSCHCHLPGRRRCGSEKKNVGVVFLFLFFTVIL